MAESNCNKPAWLRLLSLPLRWIRLRLDESAHCPDVYFRGRKYKVTGYDWGHGLFIDRIADERRQALDAGGTPARLITFRKEFRRIANWPRVHGMITCLNQSDEETVRLAIWLLGRKHARFGIPLIEPYSRSQNIRVRREAARALRRLGAWSELRAIAEYDPDEQVCRIAMPEPPKPFAHRLRRFTGDATEVPAARHSRVTSFFARVPIGPGKPAKTTEFIRAILERIHRLVHG